AVCDTDLNILSGLGALLDHSLIRHSDRHGPSARFGMLETIREYGQEQLEQTTYAAAVRDRHAQYFTDPAERVSPHLDDAGAAPWFNLLDDEHGNLLTALDWLLRRRDLEHGPRLVGALREYWFWRGRSVEGLARAEAYLSMPEMSTPTSARALALATAAWLSHWLGNGARAIALGAEALAIWDEIGDRTHSASLYISVGLAAQEIEGIVQAREYWTRGLDMARESGDAVSSARLLTNLGHAAQELGDLDLAAEHLAESQSVAMLIESQEALALVKHALGRLAYQRQDIPRAASLFRESLELYRDIGFTWGVARAIGKLAILAQHNRDAPRAARLFGCSDALHRRLASPMSRVQRQDHEPVIEATRAMLGDVAFDAAWAEGAAMSLEQAVAYALATGASQGAEQPDTLARLTPRELDVLRLVATGLTDAEVAERLFLSRRTVSSHLTSIYSKLGVSSRAAATRYAVDNGLT
ncbi:MAG TPA: LuxR C-terminal-related transcriptional regulator, partial [Thermomicrobiales bacterium]|nr:LuxR C-terminal-related transcriptional regulator [Thermomicrobiales bacterium]